MEQVCLLHLDGGNANMWSESLKKSIVVRYIGSQKDLQELLDSKRGIWASIKGFIQWVWSIITVLFGDDSW